MANTEKRKEERLRFKASASCELEGKIISALAWDINKHGLKIELFKKPEVGTFLTVILDIKPPLKLRGEIRWVDKKGIKFICGVKFVRLGNNEKKRLS